MRTATIPCNTPSTGYGDCDFSTAFEFEFEGIGYRVRKCRHDRVGSRRIQDEIERAFGLRVVPVRGRREQRYSHFGDARDDELEALEKDCLRDRALWRAGPWRYVEISPIHERERQLANEPPVCVVCGLPEGDLRVAQHRQPLDYDGEYRELLSAPLRGGETFGEHLASLVKSGRVSFRLRGAPQDQLLFEGDLYRVSICTANAWALVDVELRRRQRRYPRAHEACLRAIATLYQRMLERRMRSIEESKGHLKKLRRYASGKITKKELSEWKRSKNARTRPLPP